MGKSIFNLSPCQPAVGGDHALCHAGFASFLRIEADTKTAHINCLNDTIAGLNIPHETLTDAHLNVVVFYVNLVTIE